MDNIIREATVISKKVLDVRVSWGRIKRCRTGGDGFVENMANPLERFERKWQDALEKIRGLQSHLILSILPADKFYSGGAARFTVFNWTFYTTEGIENRISWDGIALLKGTEERIHQFVHRGFVHRIDFDGIGAGAPLFIHLPLMPWSRPSRSILLGPRPRLFLPSVNATSNQLIIKVTRTAAAPICSSTTWSNKEPGGFNSSVTSQQSKVGLLLVSPIVPIFA